MKKLFLTGLTALLFAACSSDDALDPQITGTEAEGVTRYMAVNLVASESSTTRADDDIVTALDPDEKGSYTAGDEKEYKAEKMVFFLFNEDGSAYTETLDKKNCIEQTYIYSKADDGTETNTWVEGEKATRVSSCICVMNLKYGYTKLPGRVVAVLNPKGNLLTGINTALGQEGSLKQVDLVTLRKALLENASDYSEDDNFTMTNSVYGTGSSSNPTSLEYATKVKDENFASTDDEAKSSPVSIYVERVVAKVTTSVVDENTNEHMTFSLKFTDENGGIVSGKEASYAKINLYGYDKDNPVECKVLGQTGELRVRLLGWNIFNTAYNTYFEKILDNYSGQWSWNSDALYRSYWTLTDPYYLSKENKIKYASRRLYWKDMRSGGNSTKKYPFEFASPDNSDVTATSVIYAACIEEKTLDGSSYKPADLAYWFGRYYRKSSLKEALAQYWKTTIYKKVIGGTDVERIDASDIEFKIQSDGYHVQPRVNPNSKTYLWCRSNGEVYTTEQLNSIISAAPKAQIWDNGKCYYYVSIKHPQTTAIETSNVNAIIRNHWYQISISSITGLGTPVPTPSDPSDNNGTPDDPDDDDPIVTPEPNDPTYPDPENPTYPDEDVVTPTPPTTPDDGPDDDSPYEGDEENPKDPTDETTETPDTPTPIDPNRPDEDNDNATWYLDAKIYIQPWRIITNSADLKSRD